MNEDRDEAELRGALANRVDALGALNEQVREMAAEYEALVVFKAEALHARERIEGLTTQWEEAEHHRRIAEHELNVTKHELDTVRWQLETEIAALGEQLHSVSERLGAAQRQPLRHAGSRLVDRLRRFFGAPRGEPG